MIGEGTGARPVGRVALLLIALPALAGAALIVDRLSGGGDPPLPPPAASTAQGPGSGETYLWRPVAIGGGGFITGIGFDASGTMMVARTDVHGAYRWDAAQDRWVQLVTADAMPEEDRRQGGMNEGAYEIAVAPGDQRRLYLAIKGRVFHSENGGATWSAPARRAPFPALLEPNGTHRFSGPFLAVAPGDPALVLFGTIGAGVWRSTDGGVTWSRATGVAAVAAPVGGGIPVWFGDGRAYAAPPGQGVLVSGDGGASFAPLAPAGRPGPRAVTRAAIAADGGLYAVDTDDRTAWRYAGGAWHDLTQEAGLPPRAFAGVAVNPRGGAVFVTDQGGDAWCSSDSGIGWRRLYRNAGPGQGGEPPWLSVNNMGYFASGQIAFDPAVPGRLWVAAGTGPYSADVGEGCPLALRWRSRVRGIEELVTNDVVQPRGRAPLFAAWDIGIHLKPDLDVFSTTYGPKPRFLISAQQLAWSERDPDFIVTNASDARMNCCSEDGDAVLAGFSTDAGLSWRKFETLPQPPGTRPDDPWRMAFGTIAVAASDTNDIVWEPAFDRAPYYTLDRGRTWHRVVLTGEILPATGSFERFEYARKTLVADRVLSATFYLVHSGDGANPRLAGLWRTVDGGRHWVRVFRGEIAPDSRFAAKLRAVPGHAGHLFFTSGVDFGSDTRLRRSRDGGVHWQALDGVERVDDVAFGKAAEGRLYPTIFLSGRVNGAYGIWRSVDDARSWQMLVGFPLGRLDQVTVVEGDRDVFGRVYVGYTGSGWIYGEPAACTPRRVMQGAPSDCSRAASASEPAATPPPQAG